jgi:hypothetical protein
MLALAALDNGEEADLGSFIALVVRSASNSVLLIIYYYFPIQNLTIVSIFFKFYCHMITGYIVILSLSLYLVLPWMDPIHGF